MAAVSDWEVELHREADRILKVWLDNKKRIEILEGEIGELEVNLKGQRNLSTIVGEKKIAEDESAPLEHVAEYDSSSKEINALERELRLKKEALAQFKSKAQLEYERSCSALVDKKFKADKPKLSNLSAKSRNWILGASSAWLVAAGIMAFFFPPVGISMFVAAGVAALVSVLGRASYSVYKSLPARREEVAAELEEYIDECVDDAESFSDALSDEYSEELAHTEKSGSLLEITDSIEVVNTNSPVDDKHSNTDTFKNLWEKLKHQPQFDPFDFSDSDAKWSKKTEEALAKAMQALEHSRSVVQDEKRVLERAENMHELNIAELELAQTPENKALAYRSETNVELCVERWALAELKFHYNEDCYELISRDGGMSPKREAELEQLTTSMLEQFSASEALIKAAESKYEDACLKATAAFAEPDSLQGNSPKF